MSTDKPAKLAARDKLHDQMKQHAPEFQFYRRINNKDRTKPGVDLFFDNVTQPNTVVLVRAGNAPSQHFARALNIPTAMRVLSDIRRYETNGWVPRSKP